MASERSWCTKSPECCRWAFRVQGSVCLGEERMIPSCFCVCNDARRESANVLCVPGDHFSIRLCSRVGTPAIKSAFLSVHAVSPLPFFCRPGSPLTLFSFPDQYGMEPADSATSDIDRLVLRNKNLRDAHFINTWIGQVRLSSLPLAFSTQARTRSPAHPDVPETGTCRQCSELRVALGIRHGD